MDIQRHPSRQYKDSFAWEWEKIERKNAQLEDLVEFLQMELDAKSQEIILLKHDRRCLRKDVKLFIEERDDLERLNSDLNIDLRIQTKGNEHQKKEMKILRSELENAKKSEEKVIVMEGLIENLRMEISETRKKTEMGKVVQKWMEKSKDLERRVEEALQSERIAAESMLIASNTLRKARSSLEIAESELIGLKSKVKVLGIEFSRRGAVQADPENGNKQACYGMVEMGTMIKALKSEIRKDLQQKLLSIDFKKQIHGNDMCDDFGLQVMIIKVPQYILDDV
ncbi:hypothetical protein ZOSMA_251G00190 [Zostera marina]|uniref:Uncharacterized protein n=1 Tax=Zostera marina TaxID=29655 RepID=A0A0K9PI67_ZOSMR|nr:hypothetical protein ZOSMA_251G00190 [Zostera marina]